MYDFVNFFYFLFLRSFLRLQKSNFLDCIQKLEELFQIFFFLVIKITQQKEKQTIPNNY